VADGAGLPIEVVLSTLNIRELRCGAWQMSCNTAAASSALFYPHHGVNDAIAVQFTRFANGSVRQ
jgi:hypothetical protein